VRDFDESLRNSGVRYLTGPSDQPTTNAAFLYALTSGGRILSETRTHEGRSDVYRRNSKSKGMRITSFFLSATNAETGDGAECSVQGLSLDPLNGEMSSPAHSTGTDPRSVQADVQLLENGRMQSAEGFPIHYTGFGAVDQAPLWVRLPGQTNLTAESGILHYDGLGMLQKVERGSGDDKVTVTYTRDALGRIVKREVSGPLNRCRPSTRQYVWRGDFLIEEYDKAGPDFGLLRRYFYVDSDLALIQTLWAIAAVFLRGLRFSSDPDCH
jgi:hypothetical protein